MSLACQMEAPMNAVHPMHRFDDSLDAKKQAPTGSAIQHRWSPYVSNGGTVVSVCGDNYAVVTGDTRLSAGYKILTRNSTKITRLTDKVVIASGGMQAELTTLHRVLKIHVAKYEHAHRKPPSVQALAQLLSTILYYKRFFPYYAFNVLTGIDESGVGRCYGYDAIGSFESVKYVAQGSGVELVMSVLDNRVNSNNMAVKRPHPTKEEAIELLKDVMSSASERDIYTGDKAEIFIITPNGIEETSLELKHD